MIQSSFLISVYFASGIIIFFLAVMILRHSARSIVNWATAMVLLFAGFGPTLTAFGLLMKQHLDQGVVLFQNLSMSFNYIWEFFFPSLLLFSLVYPRRHRWWRFLRKFVWIFFLPHIFHLILMMFMHDTIDVEGVVHPVSRLASRIGIFGTFLIKSVNVAVVLINLFVKAHMQLFSLVNILYAAVALTILISSIRSDVPPRVKRQLKAVAIGLGVGIFTYSWARVVPLLAGMSMREDVSMMFMNASLIIGGGSIAYAIVKYQFLGLKMIARRGIVYAVTALILASVYLLTVRQITSFIYRYTGSRAEFLETGMIILFIIIFQPLMGRIDEWSERVVLGSSKPARTKIKELMSELASMIDEAKLKERVCETISDVFGVEHVALLSIDEIEELSFPGDSNVIEIITGAAEPLQRKDLLAMFGVVGRNGDGRLQRENAEDVVDAPVLLKRLSNYSVIVPVVHNDSCNALLLIGSSDDNIKIDSEDYMLLSMLSSQIASSLSNIGLLREVLDKKLMEEELNIARNIQLNLLPSSPPTVERYDLAAVSRPSKFVGGDYYDFIDKDGMLALAVADVSGKGVPASLLMASLQASLRGSMDLLERPSELIRRLNKAMCRTTSVDRFVTMFYGYLDTENDRLMYTNAGHLFPVLVSEGGEMKILDYSGLVLGVQEEFDYDAMEVPLSKGDLFVVVTDGVTEAERSDGEYFGEERLYELIRTSRKMSAEEIKNQVVNSVMEFSGNGRVMDDVTVLVLKRME